MPALENVTLWHERDISHSSIERYIAPDATGTLDFALNRMAGVVEQLVVYAERMKANLNSLGGLVFSQRVLLALTQKGMSREESYAAVQRNAMDAWRGNASFLALCRADKEIRRVPVRRRIGGAVRHGLSHQARRHDLQAGVWLSLSPRAGEDSALRSLAALGMTLAPVHFLTSVITCFMASSMKRSPWRRMVCSSVGFPAAARSCIRVWTTSWSPGFSKSAMTMSRA